MSEPEDFLTRWSRRKSEEADNKLETRARPEHNSSASEGTENRSGKSAETKKVDLNKGQIGAEEFDLKSLPSLESIGAGTDVSVFLRAGVPAELARAALSRAWSADPNIRNFIGLSENAWDFTDPTAMPGFGPLSADDARQLLARYAERIQDAGRHIAERLGNPGVSRDPIQSSESGRSPGAAESSSPQRAGSTVSSDSVEARFTGNSRTGDDASEKLLQCGSISTAPQKDSSKRGQDLPAMRRTHGGALPK